MDLPIFQRLRKIHQTALSHLVYPTATHNRFQHSLGVLIIADQYSNVLGTRYPEEFDKNTVKELRLAALLHDIGHCPFSHPSDDILTNLEDMKAELKDPQFSKIGNKPHEILSYLFLTSKTFKQFFNDLMEIHGQDMEITNIAKLIIGESANPDCVYKSDIINGAFDADKLDYIDYILMSLIGVVFFFGSLPVCYHILTITYTNCTCTAIVAPKLYKEGLND
jgi:uncharacterized protein